MSATRVPVPFRERQRDDDLTVYEEVSLAVADGRSEQLNERQQAVLERTKAAYRIICDLPDKRKAVNKLKELYPELSEMTLYRDINYAIRIWNPMNRMDRDFLTTAFLNKLISEIYNDECDAATRAKNLATFERYLSNMPQDPMDPTIMEKHTINIQLNINGNTITVPADKWAKIKENKLIAAALDQEITEAQAEEIMES
ncbi:MAG: hypothetical protein IKH15_11320 [Bacteroidales bacterium]|nr:hypothetical protein [Bacteroidales bacterium]MBR4647737.1 hypothetical protein [Bacteroidales bacterium]MBR6904659.1 hypothetical protein [Bacteroidales bacterium]